MNTLEIKATFFVNINFKAARLPGNGSFFKINNKNPFIDMITRSLKLPHVAWDFEFFPNEVFLKRKLRCENWMGLKGVAAETAVSTLPKDKSIILLHDHHWADDEKLSRLKRLLKFLKENTQIVPLIPLPAQHPKITYP